MLDCTLHLNDNAGERGGRISGVVEGTERNVVKGQKYCSWIGKLIVAITTVGFLFIYPYKYGLLKSVFCCSFHTCLCQFLQTLISFKLSWCCYSTITKYSFYISLYEKGSLIAFSASMLLAWRQEGHQACKNWVVQYWHGYLSRARCKWFAYGPADATATPSSLAPVKSRMVYLPGDGLPRLSWKKGR